jgi:enoyl-CoA hydratase/carnithine racemase
LTFADYSTSFKTAELALTANGVLVVRFHSRGKSLAWNGLPHREYPELFERIAADRDVRAVILTGTGDCFIDLVADFEAGVAEGRATAAQMDDGVYEGVRLLENLLRIEVPVIAAVNGPAVVHAELALLSDIVICTPNTYFSDEAHVPSGLVPGDGVQIVWPLLLGINRARYFLLTGQQIHAEEARQLGLVGEIVPAEELMARAAEHAGRLAACNPIVIRNTRNALVAGLRRDLSEGLHAGLLLETVASLSGRDWPGPHSPQSIGTPGRIPREP